MKKIVSILSLSLIWIIWVQAELILTSNDIKSNTDKWYILSDNYPSYSECTTQKDKNNAEYTNYKRSECFKDSEWYKYFICKLTDSCKVWWITNTSVPTQWTSVPTQGTNTPTTKIMNQDKLDNFLWTIISMKSKMSSAKYEVFLDNIFKKLTLLWTKYHNNTTITDMVSYLTTWVKWIKEEFLKNKDLDNFFCELTDSCNEVSTISSIDKIQENKWCNVNLFELQNTYKTVPLFTTFITYNNKIYEPDSFWNLFIPYGFKDSISLWNKNTKSLVPTILTVQCNNWELSVFDSNFNKLDKAKTSTFIQTNAQNTAQTENLEWLKNKIDIFLISFNKKDNTVIFNIKNYNKHNTVMFNSNNMVLQCYYLEKTPFTSAHCISLEKISWDDNNSIFKAKLTNFAIEKWINNKSIYFYVEGVSRYNVSSEKVYLYTQNDNINDYKNILQVNWWFVWLLPADGSVKNILLNSNYPWPKNTCSWCWTKIDCNWSTNFPSFLPKEKKYWQSTCEFIVKDVNWKIILSSFWWSSCSRNNIWEDAVCAFNWVWSWKVEDKWCDFNWECK